MTKQETLEQRVDALEQALATIASAAHYGPRDPLRALTTITQVARASLCGAGVDGDDLLGLRGWLVGQRVIDVHGDDGGAVVFGLEAGYGLRLRPLQTSDGPVLLPELCLAGSEDD